MKINKKFVGMLSVAVFIGLLLLPLVARADWSVTVSWSRSAGPNLAAESVLLDDVAKCSIAPTDPTICQFNVATLSGQAVKVRSFNTQGAYVDSVPVVINSAPAPPGNLLINVTYIQP